MQSLFQLADGSTVDLSQWPIIVSPSRLTLESATPAGDPIYVKQTLAVHRHPDGRMVVRGSVDREGELLAQRSELVPVGGDAKAILWRVAGQLQLAEWLVEGCLERLDRPSRS